jgi:hypothetical protein
MSGCVRRNKHLLFFYKGLKIYNYFAWLYEVDSTQNKSIEIRSNRLFIKTYFLPSSGKMTSMGAETRRSENRYVI